MHKFKTWELALLMALSITLCIGAWAQGKQNELNSSLIRLHVLAVSDEEKEQNIKLDVRDAVLAHLGPKLENAVNSTEAAELIDSDLDGIKAAAEGSAQGRPVTVTLSEEYYPTRFYDGFALPAGRYRSLRIVLGEGKGHNWWCVVFPPLCISAAEQQRAVEAMSIGGIIADNGGYELRFRIVELWNALMEKL